MRCENDGTFILYFFRNYLPEVPFWLGIHSRAWLILNRKLQGKFIKLINFWWGSLHESLHLTCLEQKSLGKVLWLTCFILNRLLSAIVKKLKINHLKLSFCFKKRLIEVDTLLLYTCLMYFFGKKKFSFAYWQSRVFTFNTTLLLIYVKLYNKISASLMAQLCLRVIIGYVKWKEHNLIFQLMCLWCIFSFMFLIEI